MQTNWIFYIKIKEVIEMSYKKLFDNEFETYNEQGLQLNDEINSVINPIISKWMDDGYSAEDVQSIIINNVIIKIAEQKIVRGINKRKKTKSKNN
jgi:hypothetical protein